FIDPYAKGDTDNYIAYFKRDFQKEDRSFMCLVGGGEPNALEKKHLDDKIFGSENLVNNAGTLRTYRLAMAATGEYTAFHGGTVALALAAINTTMNRVNGVYERDLSVRMTLIANNNLIIYTNAATDPYTNTSGDLAANQTNITTVIGTANYDVGHLVGTGGGGVATLNSPCNNAAKARGLTGSPAPVGDPFDIDYVAHELGHQFGGNHTFNTETGSCGGGNREVSAAFETGSGATIQAYAGICGTQDLQRNSDDYFHIRSLEEMVTFISGTTCDVETASGNIVPVVTAAPACTIPQDTPFELTGSATDANGDALTYIWEEYDLGAASNVIPNTDATGARPILRSYKPTTGGATRSFPSLPFILNNNNIPPSTFTGTNSVGTVCAFGSCLTGELLPTITRTMNFQLVARDNRAGGGGVRSAQTTVTVSDTSGPFAVTSPNTAVTYNGLSNQTITWNVSSTTAAPVSCANVDILISTNGGTTFTTLLANTPNDGTQSVTIPNTGTTTARIKIKCATSCFFDISNTNFTITTVVAATASLGGRVLTAQGNGLRSANIVLTDANGNTRTVRTNAFGYYNFDELEVGTTYTLTVSRKGYTFAQPTQIITLNEDFGEANFTAE
nr:M12 family metallo-peptidase [Pyrinomonadaceae bacterium]